MRKSFKKYFYGITFLCIAAWAAIYGPFRCDNGCNATDMTDGLTVAFIRGTVNAALQQDANSKGKVHAWRPGDQLTICDGKWCVTSAYHPLTGLFIWNPTKTPAYRDKGDRTRTEDYNNATSYWRSPDFQSMMHRIATSCLRGTFDNFMDSSGAYYDGAGDLVVWAGGINWNLGDNICNG